MEDRLYGAVHEKPYNHLEEEAFLQERDPELFRHLQEAAAALPRDLVREYGLDCVFCFLKREQADDRQLTERDEDALCGIFRFLGRVYRAFSAPGRNRPAEDSREESRARYYACCARAFHALESGHLHLYAADLSKALFFIQKEGGSPEERKLFLLLLRESAPCLAGHLLEAEGSVREEGRAEVRDILKRGGAGSETVIQVMGRVRGRLLTGPEEDPGQVIKRGENYLREAGLDVSACRVKYVPGKVISFWK